MRNRNEDSIEWLRAFKMHFFCSFSSRMMFTVCAILEFVCVCVMKISAKHAILWMMRAFGTLFAILIKLHCEIVCVLRCIMPNAQCFALTTFFSACERLIFYFIKKIAMIIFCTVKKNGTGKVAVKRTRAMIRNVISFALFCIREIIWIIVCLFKEWLSGGKASHVKSSETMSVFVLVLDFIPWIHTIKKWVNSYNQNIW